MGFFDKLKKLIGIKEKKKPKSKPRKKRKKVQPIEIKEDYNKPQTSHSQSEAQILAENRKKRRRALLKERRNG